jgi:hypothetical protein
MTNISYLLDAKTPLDFDEEWDFFFSALNNSERVTETFKQIKSVKKYWIIIPEYHYTPAEEPAGELILRTNSLNEADQIIDTIGSVLDEININSKICVDITGLMRPQILFILRYFKVNNIKKFDMIYTEPLHYTRKEDTDFTLADVSEVRQVSGFEGTHNVDMSRDGSKDVLFLGVGYDSHLMSRVSLDKDRARHLQLHSLPSLSADMYQESLIRLDRAGLPNNKGDDQVFFSSANDPFFTATALSKALQKICHNAPPSNLYLSPLATKPQALGFGLFYLKELDGAPASIIFPFSERYSRETSKGIGRSWLYPIYLE